MGLFLLRRLGWMAVTMWLVSLAVFIVSEVVPIDVARNILGQEATPESIAALRVKLGLDCPAATRYVIWLVGDDWVPAARALLGSDVISAGCSPAGTKRNGIIRGDWGVSTQTGTEVAPYLLRRLRNSMILAGIAFVVIMPVSLLLGALAALREGKLLDRFISIASLVTVSTPSFASGVYLILVFALWLHWLPGVSAFLSEDTILQNPAKMVMPVMVLFFAESGYVARITRASMATALHAPYTRTAILKGLPYWQVVFRHALRNALLAPITLMLTHVSWLIGGIVVVEVVFAYPGMGRLILDASLNKDVNLIEACAMVMVFVAMATQFLADLLYTYLNPRIRFT